MVAISARVNASPAALPSAKAMLLAKPASAIVTAPCGAGKVTLARAAGPDPKSLKARNSKTCEGPVNPEIS